MSNRNITNKQLAEAILSKYESLDEARPEIGEPLPMKGYKVYSFQKEPVAVLLLETDGVKPMRQAFAFASTDLPNLARAILRVLEPSVEEEILAALHRIEDRLSESE